MTAATMRTMLEDVVADGTGDERRRSRATGRGQDRDRRASRRTTAAVQVRRVVRRVRARRVAAAGGDRRARRAAEQRIFGGQVAAPIFSRIMEYALRLERVPPTAAGAAARLRQLPRPQQRKGDSAPDSLNDSQ